MRAPADEVDNFQSVAFVEGGFSPDIAGYDGSIEFDCHAIRLHAQGFHQRGQRRRRKAEVTVFPIDLKSHFAGTREIVDGASRWENS